MKPVMRDILTGIDGKSYAIVKVLGFIVVLVFLALEIASFITGKEFDGMVFGAGAGIVIGVLGKAIQMTAQSEPEKTDD